MVGIRSRMNRETHVRLCVQERWTRSAGIKSCRGKNQKPRSLDSKVEGDQDFEAYRQHHRKDGCESPGRSASERVRGLESDRSGGRARNREGEGSMIHRNLIDAVDHSGGVEATAW